MIPLWYKDRQGKYHNFPYDMLTPDHNGIPGIDARTTLDDPRFRNFQLLEGTASIRQYFDYSPNQDRWLLKEKYR